VVRDVNIVEELRVTAEKVVALLLNARVALRVLHGQVIMVQDVTLVVFVLLLVLARTREPAPIVLDVAIVTITQKILIMWTVAVIVIIIAAIFLVTQVLMEA